MAIEYAEEEVIPTEPEMESEEAVESASIPMSLLAGNEVSTGDVIRLEVVETDPDGRMVKVKYAMPKKESSAISEASKLFKRAEME